MPTLPRHPSRRLARARGLVLNARLVARRSGTLGLAELLVARATPRTLAFRRATVLAAPTLGARPHPELEPQLLRAADAALAALLRELTATSEPEVGPLAALEIERRFADGDELALFHRDGSLAHVHWIRTEPLRLFGVTLPLEPTERVLAGLVTVPEQRERGVAAAALEHTQARLGAAGIETALLFLNGFNRRFLEGCLRHGQRRIATARAVSVAGWRWTRIDAPDAAGRDWLAARGIVCGRWLRS